MIKIHFSNIDWDTDGEPVDETELPRSVTLEADIDEDDIEYDGADVLSDEFGWCVSAFTFEVVEKPDLLNHPSNENMEHYTLHFVKEIGGEEEDLYWRCWADDYDHAVEQLRNDVEGEGSTLLFYELIEKSI